MEVRSAEALVGVFFGTADAVGDPDYAGLDAGALEAIGGVAFDGKGVLGGGWGWEGEERGEEEEEEPAGLRGHGLVGWGWRGSGH